MRGHATLGAIAALAVLALTAAQAGAQMSKCSAAKATATGKKASEKLACLSKSIAKGLDPDSTCVAKAEVKFSSSVAKAEAKAPAECLTTGDAMALGAKVDVLVSDIDDQVTGPSGPANPCDAAKVKAAGKKTQGKLACVAKAIGKGSGVDSACLAKAEVKFSSAAAKAETKVPPACAASGDFATHEALVDATVDDLEDELHACPIVTPCGGTYPSTCGGDCPCGTACVPFSSPDGGEGCGCLPVAFECPPGQVATIFYLFSVLYGCVTPPTCFESSYPTCDGNVPPGQVCQAVRSLDSGASECQPVSSGTACDETCPLEEFGACPAGEVCFYSLFGGTGFDCGCAPAGSSCYESPSCGGVCPSGGSCTDCTLVPPPGCAPGVICACSAD